MIEVMLLIIVSGLFYWFMILPKATHLKEQNDLLAKTTEEKAKISKTVDDLKKMVGQLTTYKKEIAELDEAVPLDAMVLRFRVLLENLSESVGLSVSTVNVSNNSSEPWAGNKELIANPYGVSRSMQRLSGSISVVGTYDQVIALLEKIQTSGRVININSVSIDSSENGNLSVVLALDAFYLAPNVK